MAPSSGVPMLDKVVVAKSLHAPRLETRSGR
jgi:hypothetical protein